MFDTGVSKELPNINSRRFAMCFNRKGYRIAGHSTTALSIFNANSGDLINTGSSIRLNPNDLFAFRNDDNIIRYNSNWTRVDIVDVSNGNDILTINSGAVIALAQNPTSDHLATLSTSQISIYNSMTGGNVRTLQLPASLSLTESYSMEYSPDGKYLAVAYGTRTLIFDTSNNYNRIGYIENYGGNVSFTKHLFIVGVRVYNLNKGFSKYYIFEDDEFTANPNNRINPYRILLTRDGRYFINYSGTQVRIFDVKKIIDYLLDRYDLNFDGYVDFDDLIKMLDYKVYNKIRIFNFNDVRALLNTNSFNKPRVSFWD